MTIIAVLIGVTVIFAAGLTLGTVLATLAEGGWHRRTEVAEPTPEPSNVRVIGGTLSFGQRATAEDRERMKERFNALLCPACDDATNGRAPRFNVEEHARMHGGAR